MHRLAGTSGSRSPVNPLSEAEIADLPDLPPVPLPSAAELLDAAADSPVVRGVSAFASWLGAGRPLGGDGTLTADDARDAAGALRVDGPELALLVRWARAAGLVRTLKGRLVPVKGRRALLSSPIELWRHLFTSFPEVGARADEDEPRFLAALPQHGAQMFELVQLSLYTAGGGPVPVELLVEVTLDAPVGMLGFAPYANPTPAVRREWHAHLRDALAALESLGAIRTEPSADPAVDRKIREMSARDDPDLTVAALTPIGLWAVNRSLVEQGVPAPVVGELAGAGLPQLCHGLAMASPEVVDAELAAWVQRRGPERAASEAETFLQAADEPGERLFAVRVLALADEHGPAAAHRVRAAGGIPGSVATVWLLSTGAIEQTEASFQESMLALVDQLCALADDGFVEEAFDGYPVPDQVDLVAHCARTGHPRLLEVLDAIADAPVDPKVVQAARKARTRLRR